MCVHVCVMCGEFSCVYVPLFVVAMLVSHFPFSKLCVTIVFRIIIRNNFFKLTLGFFVDEVSWRWCFWFTAICESLLAFAWVIIKPPDNHSTKRIQMLFVCVYVRAFGVCLYVVCLCVCVCNCVRLCLFFCICRYLHVYMRVWCVFVGICLCVF